MTELNNLNYDHNYYYYRFYISKQDKIIYEIISEDQLYKLNELNNKILCVNKNIPRYFHKIFLYYCYL